MHDATLLNEADIVIHVDILFKKTGQMIMATEIMVET